MSKPKYEYVVVDWGTWGIDVQLSTKIVVKDHLNVKNGDACSLQGTDPVTKRPIMFEGEVLGVFGEYVCSLFDKQRSDCRIPGPLVMALNSCSRSAVVHKYLSLR